MDKKYRCVFNLTMREMAVLGVALTGSSQEDDFDNDEAKEFNELSKRISDYLQKKQEKIIQNQIDGFQDDQAKRHDLKMWRHTYF